MTNETRQTMKAIEKLRLPELQARFAEIVGETTRSPNKTYLLRRIAEALEAQAESMTPPATTPANGGGNPGRCASPEPSDGSRPSLAEAEPSKPVATGTLECAEALAGDAHDDAPTGPRKRGRFASMSVDDLREKYLATVGRPSHSRDSRYLIWKIREAEKGRVPVGARPARRSEPVDVKILPLRLESAVVERMDEAWRTRGMKSRTEFLRRALGHYLADIGAGEVAGEKL
jgi:hypothetical protein